MHKKTNDQRNDQSPKKKHQKNIIDSFPANEDVPDKLVGDDRDLMEAKQGEKKSNDESIKTKNNY